MDKTDLQGTCGAMLCFIGNIEGKKNKFFEDFLEKVLTFQENAGHAIQIASDSLGTSNHSKHFNEAVDWLEANSNEINRYLSSKGLAHKVAIERKLGGGTKNKTQYYLVLVSIPEITEEAITSIPENGIGYTVVNPPAIKSWWIGSKPISLAGYRKWVLVLVAMVPVIVVACTLMLLLTNSINFLVPVVCLSPVAIMSLPYLAMFKNGIYLRLFKTNTLMFIGNNVDGSREIQFKTYKATCPICHGEIALEDTGLWLMRSMVVGFCRNNAALHRFTIDHVTNTGERLNYL